MTDTQPVFDAIVRNCGKLFAGSRVVLWLVTDGVFHARASTGEPGDPMPVDNRSAIGACVVEGRIIHLPDLEKAAEQYPRLRQLGLKLGYHSGVYAPLMRHGRAIGGFSVLRREAGAFNDKEMALLQTFADQAVIAIENVRLFKELHARTGELTQSVEKLTALGEVGRAVNSTLNIDTVLNTIVSRASQLAGADGCAIYEYDEADEVFHVRATHNLEAAIVETLRTLPLRKGEGVIGRATLSREPTQIPDIAQPGAYQSRLRDLLIGAGYRALISVPLLRENQMIGSLSFNRKAPGEFAPDVVEILKTFATQSALAIQNARLFHEIEDKGRQLAGRQPAQVGISRQHVARAENAAERRDRLLGSAAAAHVRRADRQAGRVHRRHPLLRPAPVVADQRHTRSLEGRSGPHGARRLDVQRADGDRQRTDAHQGACRAPRHQAGVRHRPRAWATSMPTSAR